MKLLLGLTLVFSGLFSLLPSQNDIMEPLFNNFKKGDAKEIAKHFSTSVELILIDEEDVYSKAQAEQILKEFFIKNQPSSYTSVHTVGNTNAKVRFWVIVLNTKTGKFRISMTLNKANTTFLLSELRIEHDK